MPGSAVLIAAAERLPALSTRYGLERELLPFPDSDPLHAFEAIMSRRPDLLLLEREFASSPRGIALIGRVRADPALTGTQIRIISHQGAADVDASPNEAAGGPRVSSRAQPLSDAERASEPPRTAAGSNVVDAALGPLAGPIPTVLDQRGTRRAPRFPVRAGVEVLLDGAKGTLVDVSRLGAQILTPTVFRPNQNVRLTFSDSEGTIRCGAQVVWAAFELPRGAGPRYRIGVHFVAPDAAGLDRYMERNRAS
ncbi:MAG: PilZ domain-containing protein [Vicinamibacterales bacterium]